MSTATGLPAKYDITIYQGDGWLRQFRPFYLDGAGAAQIYDTAGHTGRMAIKALKSDVTPLLSSAAAQITITLGIQGTVPNQWSIEVYIDGTDTATLPSGLVGFYDLELTDASGRTTTWFYGLCCVEGEVTD